MKKTFPGQGRSSSSTGSQPGFLFSTSHAAVMRANLILLTLLVLLHLLQILLCLLEILLGLLELRLA